jgi:hypothetical protein
MNAHAQSNDLGMPLLVKTLIATGVTTEDVVIHNLNVYRMRAKEVLKYTLIAKKKDQNESYARINIHRLLLQSKASIEEQTYGISQFIHTDLYSEIHAAQVALNKRDYTSLQKHTYRALYEIHEVEAALK